MALPSDFAHKLTARAGENGFRNRAFVLVFGTARIT